ncbi:MAG: biotin--[acetyl-CoA-carboxylase] ligase [Muribaculaceae bacterium]|nr:biotin--[acetyl-CoA-carboxylase] ligase [Muribaculaceae bacterium]
MQILKIDSTTSTNTWIAAHETELASPGLVYCKEQTAGRGQRGNSWESEPGKNITASVVFHPGDFKASAQFLISEIVALSIAEYLQKKDVSVKIKWPNDIYAENKKICGILVEHVVTGRNITRTIAGFGINLNQTEFKSDAPNPISLKMITGKNYNIDEEIKELADILEKNIYSLKEPGGTHTQFLSKLWRADGQYYNFFDRKKEERIKARITTVAEDGIIFLTTDSGEMREYAFKEIEYIL